MKLPAVHRCRVLSSPWAGVYATDIESGRHYGRHFHASYGLGVMDDGAHRSASGHGAVDAFAGDILTTNPGEVHDGRPLGAPSRRWRTMYMPPEIVASIAVERSDSTAVAFTAAAFGDAQLQWAVRRLLARMADWTAGRGDALACEEALVAACALMIERHSTVAGADIAPAADMTRVIERLADAPSVTPTLAELAGLAGLGRFQLLRRFRQALGTTPHAWLVQQRAERARGLLTRGVAIAEAAAACGFADQSHLTRVFVRCFGFTPGAWRRATVDPGSSPG
jgi:AraC-like DNA-binding protein